MRDIPNINYNTLRTKKIINENETTKTYKDFLEHYTRDDEESVSSVDSGISESKSYTTAISSLNSDGSLAKGTAFSGGRTGSFRKYMENYNNQRFNSVKPNLINKHNVIKSEIMIKVNTPLVIKEVSNFTPQPTAVDFEDTYLRELMPHPPPLPTLISGNSAPPPPPMPLHISVSVNKSAPVQAKFPHIPVKEKVQNCTVMNLATVLTENALFKRKAHESEIKTETVTDFSVSEDKKSLKPNVKTETQKHIVKPFINHRTITVEVPPMSAEKCLNDVDYDTMTVVPIADKSTKVNTSDPNVKKMVYSTYRGLLGAYNNKANGIIATLPRSMVREDRGVAKQLECIALQGGIEKINGRTNPKVEKD